MAAAKAPTADLLAARREGLSFAAIGARFGITKQSAHERITRAEKSASEVIDIPAFLPPRVAPARPSDAIVLAIIQRDGIDAAQDRWPGMTIAELQRIKNAAVPPPVITEAHIAGVEAYLAAKSLPAAVTHTLPADFDPSTVNTATAGDVIAVIERPIAERPATVEVKPRPTPALNAAYVAEVYNRHGIDEVRRRWPDVDEVILDAAIMAGLHMVDPLLDEPAQPLGVRLWRAVRRFFGRS